jgi:hypothetical protein
MVSITRRVFAVFSACGLAASASAYVGSFFGATMNGLSEWAVVLHVGVFLLLLPMFAVESSSIKDRTFFWAGFGIGTPKWVVGGIKLLGLLFAFHFVLFFFQSHAASPDIKDGEFVLNSHDHIVKVLTQAEYLTLKGAELRLDAMGWMFFYFVLTMYWWFPKRQQVRIER